MTIALYPLTVRIAYAEKFGWVLDEPDDVDKTEQPKPLPTLGRVVGGERAGVMVLVTEEQE